MNEHSVCGEAHGAATIYSQMIQKQRPQTLSTGNNESANCPRDNQENLMRDRAILKQDAALAVRPASLQNKAHCSLGNIGYPAFYISPPFNTTDCNRSIAITQPISADI